MPASAQPSRLWLGALLGFGPAAALGVGRFAYALVLPEMQRALELGFARAGLLGSANTAGYLLGSLLSHRLLTALGYRRGFFAALLLQGLSLALLALGGSFATLLALRFLQGALGALVFVGGATLLLASGGRSVATGVYYGGVGLGILASPLATALAASWQAAWLLLGLLSLALALVPLALSRALREPAPRKPGGEGSLRSIAPLLVAYGLYGAGYIGYMTFVTTGLSVPLGSFWLILGLGATLTGLAWGPLVARAGGGWGLVLALACLLGSSLYGLVTLLPWVSAFVFGVSFLGVITAITDVFRRLLPPGEWGRAMGISTAAFAAGQALGPSLSGVAGDLAGGALGALNLSSALLALALGIALMQAGRPRRTKCHEAT